MKFGKLGFLGSSLAVSALLAGSTAFAAPVTFAAYPTVGTANTASTTLYASGASAVFFFGFSAADNDSVDIFDVTKGTSTGLILQNSGTAPGTTVSMATNLGDVLVVEILNATTGKSYYSTAGDVAPAGGPASGDTKDHAYVTPSTAGTINGVSVAAGLFVGMEDLDASNGTDWDYNDDQFILTGVTRTPPVPEPGSIALLGTGILSAAGMIRRRMMAS